MAVIYLRHPLHGTKVACGDLEAANDRANGWEDFDPTAAVEVASEPALPSFLGGAQPDILVATLDTESDLPEDFPARDLLIEGGLSTWESLVGKTREELIALKGIGPKTADAIIEVMEA